MGLGLGTVPGGGTRLPGMLGKGVLGLDKALSEVQPDEVTTDPMSS